LSLLWGAGQEPVQIFERLSKARLYVGLPVDSLAAIGQEPIHPGSDHGPAEALLAALLDGPDLVVREHASS
jgi:hypothetical protein